MTGGLVHEPNSYRRRAQALACAVIATRGFHVRQKATVDRKAPALRQLWKCAKPSEFIR